MFGARFPIGSNFPCGPIVLDGDKIMFASFQNVQHIMLTFTLARFPIFLGNFIATFLIGQLLQLHRLTKAPQSTSIYYIFPIFRRIIVRLDAVIEDLKTAEKIYIKQLRNESAARNISHSLHVVFSLVHLIFF